MNDDIIIITTILSPHLSSSVLYYIIINTARVVLTLTQHPARKDAVIDAVWYFSISNSNTLRLCPRAVLAHCDWVKGAGDQTPV